MNVTIPSVSATTTPVQQSYRAIPVKSALAAILVLYLLLSVGRAVSDRPVCDEGWFANPAYNLMTSGSMGTTVLETKGTLLGGLERHSYWIMPLSPWLQAGWYKIFGFGLFQMRAISMLFGLVALTSWFFILKALWGDERVALLSVLLIAVDFAFIRSASNGRMDMMAAALGFAAFAAYLNLRDRDLRIAILSSHSLVVASGLTHPNALLPFFSLLFLTLFFDRHRIGVREALIALLPYAIGGAMLAVYISPEPALFIHQLSGNANNRLWGLVSPLAAFKAELYDRYLGIGSAGPQYLKVLLFLPYAAGLFGAIAAPQIRKSKAFQALLGCIAIYFTYFTLIEGTKLYYYLVHLTPFYAAILAAWIFHLRERVFLRPWLITVALAGFILLQVSGVIYVIRRHSYTNSYLPAVAFLAPHKTDLIMGGAELGFGLRFPDNLLDDERLGYNSGKRPELIVIDDRYQRDWNVMRTAHPEVYQYLNQLTTKQYRIVYHQGTYTILERYR